MLVVHGLVPTDNGVVGAGGWGTEVIVKVCWVPLVLAATVNGGLSGAR